MLSAQSGGVGAVVGTGAVQIAKVVVLVTWRKRSPAPCARSERISPGFRTILFVVVNTFDRTYLAAIAAIAAKDHGNRSPKLTRLLGRVWPPGL